MSVRTSHRVSAGVAPLIVAGLLLSACGGSDGAAASRPTVTLEAGETAYATLPVATTVPEPTETEAEVDTSGVQEYEVRAGDYGIKVADQFGVSLQDLENINGWSDASREFPGPGSTIKIPAGGTSQAADPAEESAAPGEGDGSASGEDEGETVETVAERTGDGCEAGSHTVVAGDIPLKLVDLYDVTLEALDEANADNPAYGRFIPGEKIVIPAKDGCD